jgi:hypothetical protein
MWKHCQPQAENNVTREKAISRRIGTMATTFRRSQQPALQAAFLNREAMEFA